MKTSPYVCDACRKIIQNKNVWFFDTLHFCGEFCAIGWLQNRPEWGQIKKQIAITIDDIDKLFEGKSIDPDAIGLGQSPDKSSVVDGLRSGIATQQWLAELRANVEYILATDKPLSNGTVQSESVE